VGPKLGMKVSMPDKALKSTRHLPQTDAPGAERIATALKYE
jgi:hypothetical protein